MNPQDLITQVRAPSDDSSESSKTHITKRGGGGTPPLSLNNSTAGENTTNTSVSSSPSSSHKSNANPRSNRSFCSLFCCGYEDDEGNHSNSKVDVENNNSAKADGGGQSKKKGGAVPSVPSTSSSSSANQKDYPERKLINSPRAADGSTNGNGNATAPWKDDQLLPPVAEHKKGMKCLVLDLDETLVHSSFKPVDDCDFVIPVEIENQVHKVYVSKRPGVDEFMKRCGELYEVVVFTASLAKYADPVLDLLDVHKVIDWRLFRESCSPFKGSYVKDMGRMGRELSKIMIVDNSPHSYAFNPENAIPVESWFSDKNDTELLDMIPILEKLADASVTDCKEALREMQISGLDALKREFQGGSSEEDEYTSSEEDYSDDGYESESESDTENESVSQSGSQSVSQSASQSNS